MGQYGSIKFPEPLGIPLSESKISYSESTDLLPVERVLLEHLEIYASIHFDFELSEVKATDRTHTIVGHFTNFKREGSNRKKQTMVHMSFELLETQNRLSAICYAEEKRPTCLEIYAYDGENFPNNGLVQTATEIHL